MTYITPDDRIYESGVWEPLQDYPHAYWNGAEWEDTQYVAYTYDGEEWVPLNYSNDSLRTWGESAFGTLFSPETSQGTLSGYGPTSINAGNMQATAAPDAPMRNYLRLYNGDGHYRWRLPQRGGANYIRFYMQTSPSAFGYNRNLMVFRDNEGNEVCTLAMFISGTESEGDEENRFLLMQDGNTIDEGLEWVGSTNGSITLGDWFDAAAWQRVEMGLELGGPFTIRIFSPFESVIPTDARTWDLSSLDFSQIATVEFGEEAFSFPELRTYTRIANVGFSNVAWPGHNPPDRHVRIAVNSGNQVVNSTSCPLGTNTVQGGRYLVACVSYNDSHGDTTVPNIQAPSGFQLLGFTYVGKIGSSDQRVFFFMYGKYFETTDTANKSFSVTGGRSGSWRINERHYVNVNPDNPVAVPWDHLVHEYRGEAGSNFVMAPPVISGPSGRGDAIICSYITKADFGSSSDITNIKGLAPFLGTSPDFPGSESNRAVTGSRANRMNNHDMTSHGLDPQDPPRFSATRVIPTTTSAGRVVLRSASYPPIGTFEPYPIPSNVVDL